MVSVVITKVPEGEAPIEVRRAWVGLELVADDCLSEGIEHRIDNDEVLEGQRLVFIVSQKEALVRLAAVNPEAAYWWYTNGFPQANRKFSFGADECRTKNTS